MRITASRAISWWVVLLLCSGWTLSDAAPTFPVLSGRVVDGAAVLPAPLRAKLEQLLAAHERQTSNQIVVVTVPTLQGYAIEDFGYQLGRHWGIGRKERLKSDQAKDNGVLLILAPKERAVRIEVGYGLEGVLTDALSSQIIAQRMLPLLRQGQADAALVAGVQAVVEVLGGQGVSNPGPPPTRDDEEGWGFWLMLVLFILGLIVQSRFGIGMSGRGGFGGGGFGGGGGGFRGGGGSFGGGGASGRW